MIFFFVVIFRFGKEHLTENGVNIVNKELYEKWLQNCNKTTTAFTKDVILFIYNFE